MGVRVKIYGDPATPNSPSKVIEAPYNAAQTSPQQAVGVGAVQLPGLAGKNGDLTVCNVSTGGQTIWIGDSGVSNLGGFGVELYPGDSYHIGPIEGRFIYAVSDAVGGLLSMFLDCTQL